TPGTVLLVGRAAHKRNELAARALVEARAPWAQRVIGVNLSPEAKATLVDGFGDRVTFLDSPSDADLRGLYAEAETFLFLGTEEGFGLPYIEALASGCNVIAIRQELTLELLGSAGLLLEDGTHAHLAAQM